MYLPQCFDLTVEMKEKILIILFSFGLNVSDTLLSELFSLPWLSYVMNMKLKLISNGWYTWFNFTFLCCNKHQFWFFPKLVENMKMTINSCYKQIHKSIFFCFDLKAVNFITTLFSVRVKWYVKSLCPDEVCSGAWNLYVVVPDGTWNDDTWVKTKQKNLWTIWIFKVQTLLNCSSNHLCTLPNSWLLTSVQVNHQFDTN